MVKYHRTLSSQIHTLFLAKRNISYASQNLSLCTTAIFVAQIELQSPSSQIAHYHASIQLVEVHSLQILFTAYTYVIKKLNAPSLLSHQRYQSALCVRLRKLLLPCSSKRKKKDYERRQSQSNIA